MKIQILEIGSGKLKTHTHLKGENVTHVDIDKECCHLEGVVDLCYLPFQDTVFDIVYCAHVVEHVKNPFRAIAEIRRVGKKAIIKVPNADHYRKFPEDPTHFFSWTSISFMNMLNCFYENVRVTYSMSIRKKNIKRIGIYVLRLLARAPNELTAVCCQPKKEKQI